MLSGLGYILNDDWESLGGFEQNVVIRFIFLEDCSDSIVGDEGGETGGGESMCIMIVII